MVVYILLFFFLLIFSLNSRVSNNRQLFAFSAFLLIIIAALRAENVGSDTVEYIYSFRNPEHSDIIEPGYRFLSWLSYRAFGDNIFCFQFLCSSIFILSIVLAVLRSQQSRTLCLFIFLISGAYLAYFNTQRQYIAIALLLPFFSLVQNSSVRSKITFILICISIGFLFHNSVVFAIMVPFFYVFKFLRVKKYLLLFIIGSFVVGVAIDIRDIVRGFLFFLPVSDSYSAFANMVLNERSIYSLMFRLIAVTLIICLMHEHALTNIYVFTMFLGFPVFFVAGMLFAGARVSENFFIAEIIGIPYLLYNYKYPRWRYWSLHATIFIYLLYVFFGRLYQNFGEVVPYQFMKFDLW